MSDVKTHEELLHFLQHEVRLFEGFSTEELEALVAESQLRSFEGNEAIIECGLTGEFIGVLVTGHAEVSVTHNTGAREVVAKLKAGDIFGEMAVMTGDRTVADVIAGNRCYVLKIPGQVVSRRILAQPRAVLYLAKMISDRSRELAIDFDAMRNNSLTQGEDPYALSLKTESGGKLLALNFGACRIRFGVFDTEDDSRDVHGWADISDAHKAVIGVTAGGVSTTRERAPFAAEDFFPVLFESMQLLDDKFLFTPFDISAVGHRVVHGGGKFSSATVISPKVIADIEALSDLAPLHNPLNLLGIRAAQKFFPDVPQVAVFDTAFHQTLPPYAYLYGLPYDWYKIEGIRRYGFHGTSHRYVSLKTAQALKRPLGELEIVSCHLSYGSSLAAIDRGRSVDTTMGMTPADGIIMSSRAGSIDPAIMVRLMERYKMQPTELMRLINHESGLKGISGISDDIGAIEAAAEEGHHRALLAHKTYCYQIRKSIGAQIAVMGGIDALTFTGEIGENSALVRSLACQGLGVMGIHLDEQKNAALQAGAECSDISVTGSRVRIFVIANNDERLLAWEALRALERNQLTLAIKSQEDLPIPVEVSAHHVHLAQLDVEKLFGAGHQLTPEHELSQPGQFACVEKVNLIGPKGRIDNVRVLGPTRKETQVEIAMTEQFKLGIQTPIRESGDLADTPGITLEGPAGKAKIERGVICAQRHIHMAPEEAMRFRVRDKYVVQVRVAGERELTFGDVVVRVNPNYRLAMHIDTDEGNAANVRTGMQGFIEEIQSRA